MSDIFISRKESSDFRDPLAGTFHVDGDFGERPGVRGSKGSAAVLALVV